MVCLFLTGMPQQPRACYRIQNDGAREIRPEQLFPRAVPEHRGQRLVYVQKLAVQAASADAVGQVSNQGTVTGLRMLQQFLDTIPLHAQVSFIKRTAHGYREVAYVIRFNDIGRALCDQLRYGFWFQGVADKDERDIFLRLVE